MCGNDNTNPLDVADLLYSNREFPAHMEDDGNNYSTTSESISESIVSDDEQQQQQQQQQEGDDNNVKMIRPVEYNDADDKHGNTAFPYGKTWATL